MLLQHHTETARRAHYWTSFNPDRAGERVISDHSAELENDLKELETAGVPQEARDSYRAKYESLFLCWLHAKSRTASAMITGPARFPTERNRKALNSEHNKYEAFSNWRDRAKKAIIRKNTPQEDNSFSAQLERYRKELATRQKTHEIMKQANAILRKAKGKDCTAELMALNLKEETAKEIQNPANFGGAGFAQFELSNNLANIKRLEDRIREMENKIEAAETVGSREINFPGGTVIINHELDRIQIRHDQKPDFSTTQELKKNGFKWAPSQQAWQRQNTDNGRRAARKLTGAEI